MRFTPGSTTGRTPLLLALLVMMPVAEAWGRCGDGVADRSCCGDINGDNAVTIDEILTFTNIALGGGSIGAAGDTRSCCGVGVSSGGCIDVAVVVSLVDTALHGCPATDLSEPPEECDDGGTCIGGPSAGQVCAGETDCQGDAGVCQGGVSDGTACVTSQACDDGECIKCKTFGGDGCAANCTTEAQIRYPLVPGELNPNSGVGECAPETSCTLTYASILTLPLNLDGELMLTVGKERGGHIPVVINPFHFQWRVASSDDFACVRGLALKTCGGTLFESNGTLSPACDMGLEGDTDCPSTRPCAAPFGRRNAAAGEIGCNGLADVESRFNVDCGGYTEVPEPLGLARSGSGPAGSAFLYGTALLEAPPPEGVSEGFCSEDDRPAGGDLIFMPLTTGSSFSAVHNIFGHRLRVSEQNDPPTQTFGRPFACSDIENGITSGAVLIGASGGCGEHFYSLGPFVLKFVAP